MRVTCKHCGGPHPAFECRKKESTAARKDVQGEQRQHEPCPEAASRPPEAYDMPSVCLAAGTQALPVDTNSEKGRVFAAPRGIASPANASDAKTENTKDAPKFDKKAWMREYMRDHRKGILRRPKPTTKREKDE